MDKVLKVLAALTGVLVAFSEVLTQANKYIESKKEQKQNEENPVDKK